MEEPETREEVTVEEVESIAWTADMRRESPVRSHVTLIELNRTTTTTTTETIDVETDEVLDTDVDVAVSDARSGRTWTEPLNGMPAGLPGLRDRLRARVIADNQLRDADAEILETIRSYLASL